MRYLLLQMLEIEAVNQEKHHPCNCCYYLKKTRTDDDDKVSWRQIIDLDDLSKRINILDGGRGVINKIFRIDTDDGLDTNSFDNSVYKRD